MHITSWIMNTSTRVNPGTSGKRRRAISAMSSAVVVLGVVTPGAAAPGVVALGIVALGVVAPDIVASVAVAPDVVASEVEASGVLAPKFAASGLILWGVAPFVGLVSGAGIWVARFSLAAASEGKPLVI